MMRNGNEAEVRAGLSPRPQTQVHETGTPTDKMSGGDLVWPGCTVARKRLDRYHDIPGLEGRRLFIPNMLRRCLFMPTMGS